MAIIAHFTDSQFFALRRPKFTKLTKFKAPKMAKTAFLELLVSQKLISCKIYVSGKKSQNFHSVVFFYYVHFDHFFFFFSIFLGVGGALLLEKLVAIRKRRINDRLENQAQAIIALTQRISQTMPTAPNLNDIQNAIWAWFKS